MVGRIYQKYADLLAIHVVWTQIVLEIPLYECDAFEWLRF
jgi:hypothetical protein